MAGNKYLFSDLKKKPKETQSRQTRQKACTNFGEYFFFGK
jgi:hypothetical protein